MSHWIHSSTIYQPGKRTWLGHTCMDRTTCLGWCYPIEKHDGTRGNDIFSMHRRCRWIVYRRCHDHASGVGTRMWEITHPNTYRTASTTRPRRVSTHPREHVGRIWCGKWSDGLAHWECHGSVVVTEYTVYNMLWTTRAGSQTTIEDSATWWFRNDLRTQRQVVVA